MLQWRPFSKSWGMVTGVKSSWKCARARVCMRPLFMLSYLQWIVLIYHNIHSPTPGTNYLWQLLIAIPHIDTQSRGWTAYSAVMLWALYLIQPQYANTYPLFYFDNVICRDGARNLPQINIYLTFIHARNPSLHAIRQSGAWTHNVASTPQRS